MNTEQILKVLKNERECIKRQSRPLGEMPQCRKDDDGVKLCEYCDLCLPDTEILKVYDFLIEAYSITEIHINVSKEESEKLIEIINRNARQGVRLAVIPYPDIGECYPTVTLTTEEPLTEFDATPLSGDYKTVAHSRVMAETWKKGDTK